MWAMDTEHNQSEIVYRCLLRVHQAAVDVIVAVCSCSHKMKTAMLIVYTSIAPCLAIPMPYAKSDKAV